MGILLRRRYKNTKSCRLKIGDRVRVTKKAIDNKISKNAGRPINRPDLPINVYFNINETYVIKDSGMYSDGHHVLVHGGSQFIHEDYFIKY